MPYIPLVIKEEEKKQTQREKDRRPSPRQRPWQCRPGSTYYPGLAHPTQPYPEIFTTDFVRFWLPLSQARGESSIPLYLYLVGEYVIYYYTLDFFLWIFIFCINAWVKWGEMNIWDNIENRSPTTYVQVQCVVVGGSFKLARVIWARVEAPWRARG